MSTAKPFDLEDTMTRLDGDMELLKELIGIFQQEKSSSLDSIRNAITQNNNVDLEKSAHSIKGALGNIGAALGYERALALEKLGKSGTTNGAAALLAELEDSIARFEEAVKSIK